MKRGGVDEPDGGQVQVQASRVSKDGKQDVKLGGADGCEGAMQVQASDVSRNGMQDVKLRGADESEVDRCGRATRSEHQEKPSCDGCSPMRDVQRE